MRPSQPSSEMDRIMKMETLILLLTIGLVIGGIAAYMKISPAKSTLQVTGDEAKFPVVSGFNLNRQELVFPRDFKGNLNLVIVPFQQSQQTVVNTWIPFAQKMELDVPGFMYYELPTIYEMPSFSRTFINEGMRAGIPNEATRARTITLYVDKQAFRKALEIDNEQNIWLYLFDKSGNVLWRIEGRLTKEKGEALRNVIDQNRQ